MDEKSKIVLITGVSGGLGGAAARCFLAHGHTVIGVSRHAPAFALPDWVAADVTRPEDRAGIVRVVGEKYGRLDLLVNCAGKGAYATWEELPEAELRALFELDFFSVVALTKALLPLLEKTHGTVVNVSSAAARLWVPCMGSYCAAKAAVAMFSNTLGIELARKRIRVLDFAPGQIDTGFSRRAFTLRSVPDSPGAKRHSPEKFAAALYRAWEKGEKRATYPPFLGAALFFIRAVIPGIYERISRKLWKL